MYYLSYNYILIVCRMKYLTIPRSLMLLSVLFCVVCMDTMESGEELMNNDTVEMILLNTSQYCFVDDNTIRVDLNTTTLLNIIDTSEDVIMAKAVGNDNVIFTAPLNGSRCMDDNEDDQLSTTLYIIQTIIYSITILVAIANITLHLMVKDLRTISGMLVLILCINVIIFTFIAIGVITNIYIDNLTVVCVVLINFSYELVFVYQATKLSILYQFAHLMYQSYKLKREQEENIRKSVLKYIIFITGSSFVCLLLALAVDVGVNGRLFSDKERYCLVEDDLAYQYLFVMLVYGEFVVFIILQCIAFAVGLTLYFLVSKECCAMKSTNFRVIMVLVGTMGYNVILLIILSVAEVPYSILITAVISGTLVEQLILLTLFLSSKKVLLACRIVCKEYKQKSNMTDQQSVTIQH